MVYANEGKRLRDPEKDMGLQVERKSGTCTMVLRGSSSNNNNNNNLSCGNPQPEAIGHTRTSLQPRQLGNDSLLNMVSWILG